MKRNIPIDRKVWLKILDHFVDGQQEKGPEVEERVTLMRPSDKEAWNSRVKLIDGDKKAPEADKDKKSSKTKEKQRAHHRCYAGESRGRFRRNQGLQARLRL